MATSEWPITTMVYGAVPGCAPSMVTYALNTEAPKPMKEPRVNLDAIALGIGGQRQDKVYIAGPMRGLPGSNYEKFNAVAKDLRGDGIEVENPAEHFDGDPNREISEYMQAAYLSLMTCDSIALLPGWEDSEGAQAEVTAAKLLGHKFCGVRQDSDGHWFLFSVDAPEKTELPETIDREARRLVFKGQRQEDYGHPRGDFDKIGKIWSAILGCEVSAEQVAICMAGLKLARLSNTPQHHDSKVDVIGYTLCLDRLQDGAE